MKVDFPFNKAQQCDRAYNGKKPLKLVREKNVLLYVKYTMGILFKIQYSIDMLLEDYFDFLADDDIRVKSTRIGIETILYDYLFKAKTPEEIANTYTSLNLEQVYATILYYLHNKEKVSAYITDWLEWGEKMRVEQKLHPHPVVERLRKLKAEKLANLASCSNT